MLNPKPPLPPARGLERRTMKDIIEEALYLLDEDEESNQILEDVSDLQQSGYLTNDEGLVVKLSDGRKFIITIQEV